MQQQHALTSQVNSLQKRDDLKEAVTPVAVTSRVHKMYFPQAVDKVVLLPTPVEVPSECISTAAPMSTMIQGEINRVTDGNLSIRMFFPCYSGPQDQKDPLEYLQRCNNVLSLEPLSNSEILATMRSVLHGSARD